MMRKNMLYTVNKLNQLAFMPKGNLFYDGGQSSYSLPPLESYLPQGLSNDTYRKLAIGSAGQMQNAFRNYSQRVVSNFGKGALTQNNSPFQSTSMLNTDSNTFFNAVKPAGTLGSAAREKGTGLFSKDAWKSGGSGWAAAGAAAGVLGSINTGERRGMWDTLDPVHHIAGGRESKVGNAMGDAGVALTQAGLSSGQPWFALAGAGLKVVGDLTNAAFGIKEDKAKVEAANKSINQNENYVFNGSLDDIPEIAVATDTNAYKGGWFSGGEAAEKNENLKKRMINARDWAFRSRDKGIYNLLNNQMSDMLASYHAYGGGLDMPQAYALGVGTDNNNNMGAIEYEFMSDYLNSKRRQAEQKNNMGNMFAGMPSSMFAFGGDLQTMGADFPTGLVHIGTGNTHELNPYGGVQVGTDQEGTPNLVEEGETIYDDYVFSNRLIVPRGMRGNYGKRNKYAKGGKLNKGNSDGQLVPYELEVLKPFEGLTFADAAKKAEKLSGADERPTDPIAQRGLLAMLQVLAGTQEKEREKEKLQEMKDAIDNMTPEEFAMLLQQMYNNQQQANDLAMLELQQMIPLGIEYMQLQPVELPIAALGGLLDTYGNTYAYGGNLDAFKKDLKNNNISIEDYLRAYYDRLYDKKLKENPDDEELNSKELFIDSRLLLFKATPDVILNDGNFDKDFAETFLNRVNTITKQYNRRAKKQGIKVDDLQGATKAQYDRELNQAIQKGLTDADYAVSQDTELTFNNSSISTAKNKLQAYSNAATYNDLIARGGRAVELDDLGRPTWESIAGLNKIDNSADNFYTNLGDLTGTALNNRGIYDYNAAQKSSIDVDDYNNVKLRGWNKNEDGTYTVSSEYDNPNQTSLNPGNSDTTYPVADIGDLKSGSDEYKEALKAILDNEDYKKLTDYVVQALEDANGEVKNLSSDVLNYIKYLDDNSGNIKGKLLNEDGSLSANAAKDYKRRREDSQYGIYHYLFDNAKNAAANRYYYKDKDKDGKDVKVYISKPEGTDFTISENPTVTTGTDGTLFNDYEVAGLNRNRTLTLLPTGEVVDVTNLADLSNWKKLDKPVLVDNTDNLGYGINGTTGWVDYGSSPIGQKVIEDENPFPKPSSWPFELAAGLQLGSLGYNILKPADYSNADAMIEAALNAGTYYPIEFNPIPYHIGYEPDDPWFYISPIIALSNATLRTLSNKVSPSKGAETLLNSYTTMLALGNALRQALEHNFDKKYKVANYLTGVDTTNSEGFLKGDMANQDAASRAAGYSLEGQKAGYAMRLAIDDAKANAISAGLSGLANLAYNYGTNKDLINLLKWLGKSGANGPMDMSRYGRKPAAHGGRIRRKKGLSF